MIQLTEVKIEYDQACCQAGFGSLRELRGRGESLSSCSSEENEEGGRTRMVNGKMMPVPKRQKKRKITKKEKIVLMGEQVNSMMQSLQMQDCVVTMTPAQYRQTVRGLEENIRMIPLDTKIPELQKLRDHIFRAPPRLRIRMPMLPIEKLLMFGRGKDLQCKGCDQLFEPDGRYVPTLICLRTKFHPACAAVLIHGLGPELFYECLARMSSREWIDKHTKLIPREKLVDCRHPVWKKDKDLMMIIDEGREILYRRH
jgi:hypothetical protein